MSTVKKHKLLRAEFTWLLALNHRTDTEHQHKIAISGRATEDKGTMTVDEKNRVSNGAPATQV